jgi:hypothetical protein
MESVRRSTIQTWSTVYTAVVGDALSPDSFDRLVSSIRIVVACLAISHVVFVLPDGVGEENFVVDCRVHG